MKSRIRCISSAALVAALALAYSQHSPAAEAGAGKQAQAADERKQAQESADTERRLAEAQRELERAARQVAELSSELGRGGRGDRLFAFTGGPAPRAMIGVQLSSQEGQGGAKVEEVSPGGPAAEAGVKAGDIITSIGGQDLTKESDPSRTLVERMRDVDPNLKVQLGVLRDGKKLNLDVTPRVSPQVFRLERRGGPDGPGAAREFNLPPLPPLPGARGERGEFRGLIMNRADEGGMGLRFRGIEFATLSERLGSYFGVKSGVLVVRAGSNPAFKLQDGDVILAIDGRAPSSAQHAGRILRSYQPGEKLTIRVQRDHKAQNLEVTAPGGGED
jgi:S1-C subfamily serine protease